MRDFKRFNQRTKELEREQLMVDISCGFIVFLVILTAVVLPFFC